MKWPLALTLVSVAVVPVAVWAPSWPWLLLSALALISALAFDLRVMLNTAEPSRSEPS